MVLTDDPITADSARRLRNLAFGTTRRFEHSELGFNFRLTNLQAALGVAQIDRMPEIIARKRQIAHRYLECLQKIESIRTATEKRWARSIFWMFGIVLSEDSGMDADQLADQLSRRGIETRPFFVGLHRQPALRDRGLFRNERYPVTDALEKYGLYLPSGINLSDDQLDEVCNAVEAILS